MSVSSEIHRDTQSLMQRARFLHLIITPGPSGIRTPVGGVISGRANHYTTAPPLYYYNIIYYSRERLPIQKFGICLWPLVPSTLVASLPALLRVLLFSLLLAYRIGIVLSSVPRRSLDLLSATSPGRPHGAVVMGHHFDLRFKYWFLHPQTSDTMSSNVA